MKLTINNPGLSEPIKSLKYIGPLIATRLRSENIRTLADLKDLFERQSRAQNIRFMRRILENPRSQECVGETKYLSNPPNGMNPGYYKYCIRRVNRGGWYAIVTYLKRKGVSPSKLPSSDPPRGTREVCVKQQKCASRKVVPRKFIDRPMNELELAVYVFLQDKKPRTAKQIFDEINFNGGTKTMVAVLRGNTGKHGKKLFRIAGQRGTRTAWELKPTIRRKLAKMSRKEMLDYIRKL